jgi:hypothetical protein
MHADEEFFAGENRGKRAANGGVMACVKKAKKTT